MRCFLLLLSVVYVASAEKPFITIPPGLKRVENGLSGQAGTTHYWDCCKPACGWLQNGLNTAVRACQKDGVNEFQDAQESSVCQQGNAYACTKQHAFAVNNTFAFGLSSIFFGGLVNNQMDLCCTCYLLEFQGLSTPKYMVVQMINSGDDYQKDVVTFDLATPGGGVGYYNGCTDQWGAPPDGWGQRYGGVYSREQCQELPPQLRDYCTFRFDFLEGIDNPKANFAQVDCPAEVTALTQCTRAW